MVIHTAFGFDGSVRIKADLNHNNFDRGLSSMKKQVDSFGSALKRLAGTVAMAFGTAALISFGKESVKLASDIQEVQNVIDVTFGQGAAEIEEFAKSAAEAFGLSELSAKQYTGTMGAMLKSSGLATSAAQEMSLALSGLTGDMASFYNLDTDTAFEKIRSGISGETEPLKQLGINMSVANLEAYALSQGITKSYSAMSQAEQVLLRYNYLLSVTGDAQGDFARTSGSFANQIRLLQLNFDQLRISVGSALIPIAQAVLPSINAIIAGLTKLANVFAQVTALLFGKSAEVKAASGVAVSAVAAADATDRLSESTAGAGEAAKKAAKDMKGVLTGFDELNILASAAADSMDDAAGGMGGAGGLEDIELSDGEIWGDAHVNPEISAEIYALTEKLKEMIPLIAGIGAGFLAWKIAKTLIPDLGLIQGLLGSAMVAVGVTLLVDSIKDIIFGDGLTWQNILKGAAGGAIAGGGLGFMLAKALGLTWAQGMLGGAVIGLGLALLVESIADIIVRGLNIGNGILGAIGGAIAGAAAGFLFLGGPGGAVLGATIGVGVSLLLESIADIIVRGLNIGNGILGAIGGAIAGAAAGFLFLGGPGGAVLGATIGVGVSLLLESIADIITHGQNLGNSVLGLIAGALIGSVAGLFPGVGGPLVGATIGVGLTLLLQGITSQINSGVNLWGALQTIIGSALAGAGIGFAIGGGVGAAAGFVIGLVAGILLEITGIKAAGEAAYAATEDFQTMSRILDECEDSANRSSFAMETLRGNIDNLTTSLAEVGAAQQLVDEIYAINENANASAYELETMATKVELLNSMNLEGLHLTIDETTGRIIETKEATDQLIVSLQKEAETAALQELLVQAYKDRYQAVADAEDSVKKIDAAEQALKKTEQELTNTPWWDFQKHAELTAQQEKQTEALEAATDARDKAVTAYEELSGAIDTYSGALTDLSEPEASVGVQLEERMASVRQTVEGVAADMPGYGKNIGEGLEKGMSDGVREQETKNNFQRIGDWFKKLFGINSPSKVFDEYGGFLMSGLYNGLNQNLPPITNLLSGFFTDTETSASNTWENVASNTSNKWNEIKNGLLGKFGEILSDSDIGFSNIKDTIIGKIDETMSSLLGKDWMSIGTSIVNGVLDGLGSIFNSLRNWASDVWDTITGAFSTDKAKSTVKKGVNSAARQSGSYTRTIQTAAVPETYRLPMLANGAVIPPNQQFAAILGDQRSGKNIEAPLSTIERALENVLLRNGGAGGTTAVNVSFTGSLSELARILQPAITVETRRRGMSLTEVRT